MISVLMRSHNDIQYISSTVEALLTQDVDDTVEVISCDDHSTDGTAEYLASVPQLRRIAPPAGKYVPGKTLNHMVSQARGEFIVFNNADAIPQNDQYLKNLISPLKSPETDCVFGNQIARKDAFCVVRKDYERAFGDGSISCNWGKFFSLVASGFRKAESGKRSFLFCQVLPASPGDFFQKSHPHPSRLTPSHLINYCMIATGNHLD